MRNIGQGLSSALLALTWLFVQPAWAAPPAELQPTAAEHAACPHTDLPLTTNLNFHLDMGLTACLKSFSADNAWEESGVGLVMDRSMTGGQQSGNAVRHDAFVPRDPLGGMELQPNSINGRASLRFSADSPQDVPGGKSNLLHVENHSNINTGAEFLARLIIGVFRTGNELNQPQIIFEEGGSWRGFSFTLGCLPVSSTQRIDIVNADTSTALSRCSRWDVATNSRVEDLTRTQGYLGVGVFNIREWNAGHRNKSVIVGRLSKQTPYYSTIILDSQNSVGDTHVNNILSIYVNGVRKQFVNNVEAQGPHGGKIGIGRLVHDTVFPIPNDTGDRGAVRYTSVNNTGTFVVDATVAGWPTMEFDGWIGELAHWNHVPSLAELEDLDNYIANKWNLLLVKEIVPVRTPTRDTLPEVTFFVPKAADLSYSGDCVGSLSRAEVGNNTMTLGSALNADSTLAPFTDGNYEDCIVRMTYRNDADTADYVSEYYVSSFVIDSNLPELEEILPVGTFDPQVQAQITNQANPTITIGFPAALASATYDLEYGGSCSGTISQIVHTQGTAEQQVIQLGSAFTSGVGAFADNAYSDCTIAAKDAAGTFVTTALQLSNFLVATQPPLLTNLTLGTVNATDVSFTANFSEQSRLYHIGQVGGREVTDAASVTNGEGVAADAVDAAACIGPVLVGVPGLTDCDGADYLSGDTIGFTIDELVQDTDYTLYMVLRDRTGTYSDIHSQAVTTIDNTPVLFEELLRAGYQYDAANTEFVGGNLEVSFDTIRMELAPDDDTNIHFVLRTNATVPQAQAIINENSQNDIANVAAEQRTNSGIIDVSSIAEADRDNLYINIVGENIGTNLPNAVGGELEVVQYLVPHVSVSAAPASGVSATNPTITLTANKAGIVHLLAVHADSFGELSEVTRTSEVVIDSDPEDPLDDDELLEALAEAGPESGQVIDYLTIEISESDAGSAYTVPLPTPQTNPENRLLDPAWLLDDGWEHQYYAVLVDEAGGASAVNVTTVTATDTIDPYVVATDPVAIYSEAKQTVALLFNEPVSGFSLNDDFRLQADSNVDEHKAIDQFYGFLSSADSDDGTTTVVKQRWEIEVEIEKLTEIGEDKGAIVIQMYNNAVTDRAGRTSGTQNIELEYDTLPFQIEVRGASGSDELDAFNDTPEINKIGTRAKTFRIEFRMPEAIDEDNPFTVDDLTLTGGTLEASSFRQRSDRRYEVEISHSFDTEGMMELSIEYDAMKGSSGRANAASSTQIFYDVVPPQLVAVRGPDPAAIRDEFDIEIEFDEPVTGLLADDIGNSILIQNADFVSVSGQDGNTSTIHLLRVDPNTLAGQEDTVTITISGSGIVEDDVGNSGGQMSIVQTITVDDVAPSLSSFSPGYTEDEPLTSFPANVRLVFSEGVQGLVPSDIKVNTGEGGTSISVVQVTSDGTEEGKAVEWIAELVSNDYNDRVEKTFTLTINANTGLLTDYPGNPNRFSEDNLYFNSLFPTLTLEAGTGVIDCAVGNLTSLCTNVSDPVFTIRSADPLVTVGDQALTQTDINVVSGPAQVVSVSQVTANQYNMQIDLNNQAANGQVNLNIPQGSTFSSNNNRPNVNTSLGFIYDLEQPSYTLSLKNPDAGVNNVFAGGTFPVIVRFSEPVKALEASNFSTDGLTITQIDGSGSEYEVSASSSPVSAGQVQEVRLDLNLNQVIDQAGNHPTAGTPLTFTVDNQSPNIDTTQLGRMQLPTQKVRITFSEPVQNFTPSSLQFREGTMEVFSKVVSASALAVEAVEDTDGSVYDVTIQTNLIDEATERPLHLKGSLTFRLKSGTVQDLVGNIAAQQDFTITYNSTFPQLYILPSTGVQQSAAEDDEDIGINASEFSARFSFSTVKSEPVTGFSASDISVEGATLLELESENPDDIQFVGKFRTTQTEGEVTISVDAGAAEGTGESIGLASQEQQVTWIVDDIDPVISAVQGVDRPTREDTVSIDVSFSKDVFGMTVDSLRINDSQVTSVEGERRDYTVVVDTQGVPEGQRRDLELSILPSTVTDRFGNEVTELDVATIDLDRERPTLASNEPDFASIDGSILTFVFDEPLQAVDGTRISTEIKNPQEAGLYARLVNEDGDENGPIFQPDGVVPTERWTAGFSTNIPAQQQYVIQMTFSQSAFLDIAGNENQANGTYDLPFDSRDGNSPVVGTGLIANRTMSGVTLSWVSAADFEEETATPATDLVYELYYRNTGISKLNKSGGLIEYNEIKNTQTNEGHSFGIPQSLFLSEPKAEFVPDGVFKGLSAGQRVFARIYSLQPQADYHFTLLVKDRNGNWALYDTASIRTTVPEAADYQALQSDFDADGDGINDQLKRLFGESDLDADGLPDGLEYNIAGLDPFTVNDLTEAYMLDQDQNNIPDIWELVFGAPPQEEQILLIIDDVRFASQGEITQFNAETTGVIATGYEVTDLYGVRLIEGSVSCPPPGPQQSLPYNFISACPSIDSGVESGDHLIWWQTLDNRWTRTSSGVAPTQDAAILPLVRFAQSEIQVQAGQTASIPLYLTGPTPERDEDLCFGGLVRVRLVLEGDGVQSDLSDDLRDQRGGAFTLTDWAVETGSERYTLLIDQSQQQGEASLLVEGSEDRPCAMVALGSPSSIELVVTEDNIAPIGLVQGEYQADTAAQPEALLNLLVDQDGSIRFEVRAEDANADEIRYTWSAQNELATELAAEAGWTLDIAGDTTQLEFDIPAGGFASIPLQSGLYEFSVTLTDANAASQVLDFSFEVCALAPVKPSEDSDRDGLSNGDEGSCDYDGDLIPDYLDATTLSSSSLPIRQQEGFAPDMSLAVRAVDDFRQALNLRFGEIAQSSIDPSSPTAQSNYVTLVTLLEVGTQLLGPEHGSLETGYDFYQGIENFGLFDFTLLQAGYAQHIDMFLPLLSAVGTVDVRSGVSLLWLDKDESAWVVRATETDTELEAYIEQPLSSGQCPIIANEDTYTRPLSQAQVGDRCVMVRYIRPQAEEQADEAAVGQSLRRSAAAPRAISLNADRSLDFTLGIARNYVIPAFQYAGLGSLAVGGSGCSLVPESAGGSGLLWLLLLALCLLIRKKRYHLGAVLLLLGISANALGQSQGQTDQTQDQALEQSQLPTLGHSLADVKQQPSSYIGIGLGPSVLKPGISGANIVSSDEQSTSRKIFFGREFRYPFDGEVFYADMGTAKYRLARFNSNEPESVSISYKALGATLLYKGPPLARGFSYFIKLGGVHFDFQSSSSFYEISSTRSFVGAGVDWIGVGGQLVRLEYERYASDARQLIASLRWNL